MRLTSHRDRWSGLLLRAVASILLAVGFTNSVGAQTPQEKFMRIMPAIQLLLDTGLPGPSATMAPGGLDQTGYGRAYGEDVDEVNIDFDNPGEDLVLFVKGFDVDSDTEIEVLFNGVSIGFLSEGLNDGLSGGNAFTLELANMLPGQNRFTFRVSPAGENWGIAEIELETVPQYKHT